MESLPEKLERWITTLVLILVGFSAVIVALWHHDIIGISDLSEADILHLTYMTVGVLAVALGIERLMPFRRWSHQLKRMDERIESTARDLLEKSSWAWFLPGDRLAYHVGADVCEDAESHIRALTLGQSPRVGAELAESIVKRLQAGRNRSLKFTSVYSVDFPDLPAGFESDANWRMQLHKNAGVEDQAKVLFVNQKPQVGFGILLVDDKHTVIGILDPDTRQYRGVLLFRNQPEVTKHLVAWFDNSVMRYAKDYREWLAEPQKHEKPTAGTEAIGDGPEAEESGKSIH